MTRTYHTLLPIDERQALRREYRFRVVIVLCFMLSLAGIVGIGALLPAFMHTLEIEREVKSELVSVKKAQKGPSVAEIERNLNTDISLLAPLLENVREQDLSNIIQDVVRARGITTITSLNISRASTSTVIINIQGISPTRDELLSLKTRLESLSAGNKVVLPVSQLAKGSNLQYSIQLTAKLQ